MLILSFCLIDKKLISIENNQKCHKLIQKYHKIDYVATNHQWNQQQLHLDSLSPLPQQLIWQEELKQCLEEQFEYIHQFWDQFTQICDNSDWKR